MSINVSNDNEGHEETDSKNLRIIHLNPEWSEIKGLTPPLSDDAKKTILKEKIVQDAFINPQYLAILKDAQNRFLPTISEGIGFRGIMVSTDEPVLLTKNGKEKYDIPDMKTVLKNGTELPTGDILVSRQKETDKDITSTSHYRVLQYLTNGVNNILNAESDIKKKLTPAILVYDLSKLTQIDGYKHNFKNEENRGDAILALYLINIEPAK